MDKIIFRKYLYLLLILLKLQFYIAINTKLKLNFRVKETDVAENRRKSGFIQFSSVCIFFNLTGFLKISLSIFCTL